jgi:hypothetical protein
MREERGSACGFVKRDPTPLLRRYDLTEQHQRACVLAASLRDDIPTVIDGTTKLVDRVMVGQTAADLVSAYTELLTLHDAQERDDSIFTMRADADHVLISGPGGHSSSFVGAVATMLSSRRSQGRRMTPGESAAVEAAYRLLDRGVAIAGTHHPIGVSGFRRYQTPLSVADPGDSHVRVTCREAGLLRGLVVHVEHIDRDQEFDREKVEPYRMPAPITAARVRLHAGADAPCSVFIGRPVFESESFRRDLLKTVHLFSGAASAMFMNGVADCKLALEHMTAAETIEFMRAIVGNVVRDPARQYLTAALNLNTPIVDDRHDIPVRVSDPFAVAHLGIELALAGGFDRIGWDGAGNTVPAVPVVEQLGFPRMLALVHHAHERGLETYISAGMLPDHMRTAVSLGVGGVGMGTSLHHIDPDTKLMGPLKPDAIRRALDVRDEAALQWPGRGAALLARLDRLFYEKALPAEWDCLRTELFEALQAQDQAGVLRVTRRSTMLM